MGLLGLNFVDEHEYVHLLTNHYSMKNWSLLSSEIESLCNNLFILKTLIFMLFWCCFDRNTYIGFIHLDCFWAIMSYKSKYQNNLIKMGLILAIFRLYVPINFMQWFIKKKISHQYLSIIYLSIIYLFRFGLVYVQPLKFFIFSHSLINEKLLIRYNMVVVEKH